MSDSADAIRADIERTRQGLGSDVDALADKVSPSKAVERQKDKVRGAIGAVRERVMGAADDAGSSASDLAHGAADAAHSAASSAKSKAAGSPLAVGVIAFGAGLLLAALIPASAKEKELAGTVREQAQPLVDEVKTAAQNVVSDLKEPAQDAAAAVKDRAQEAVSSVKDEASGAAGSVKDSAQQARENISGS